MKRGERFLSYIHEFRGLAIILIVASHVFYGLMDENPVIGFLNATVRNSTVLFLFISGYLFQHLSAKYETGKYYWRKVKYVIAPYVVVSIPIIVMNFIAYSSKGENMMETIVNFVTHGFASLANGGHLLPFWYIPVIVVFFALAPVIIQIDRYPKWYYLLPILITISFFVPRDELNNIPKMVVHFFSVYIAGMFMSHYKDKVFEISKKYWVLFTSISVALFIAGYLPEQGSFYYFGLQYLKNLTLCWLVLYWFQKAQKSNKMLELTAEYSFGIYFLHFPFLMVYKKLMEMFVPVSFNETSLLWVPVFLIGLVFSLTGSMVLIAIIKKIFGKHSRILIGS